ncbi:MAG: FHA domain-containing protein [Rhodopirellula sp.]|nr:FHA domain-containing protein [Rhodopirellula sp.]
MISSFFSLASKVASTGSQPAADRYMAWIDGVGAWLILTGSSVSLGRVNGNVSPLIKTSAVEPEADIALVANLSRNHATIKRVDENYVLQPNSSVRIQGRPISDETVLPDFCEITLGESVRLAYSIPTPLSATAKLTFASEHRPRTSIDGVILMAETCLLGPSPHDHIFCPNWSQSVVLVQTPAGIVARSKQELQIDGRRAGAPESVSRGQVVSGEDFRFRLEPLN